MLKVLRDVKLPYDRIVIDAKKVTFYIGSEPVAEIDAYWDKDRGDTLTLSDLEGSLKVKVF